MVICNDHFLRSFYLSVLLLFVFALKLLVVWYSHATHVLIFFSSNWSDNWQAAIWSFCGESMVFMDFPKYRFDIIILLESHFWKKLDFVDFSVHNTEQEIIFNI